MNLKPLKYLSIFALAGAVSPLVAQDADEPGEALIYPPVRKIVSGSNENVSLTTIVKDGTGAVWYSFDPDFNEEYPWGKDLVINEPYINNFGKNGVLTVYVKAVDGDDEGEVDSARFTVVPKSPWTGNGTQTSPYQIQNYDDLIELAARVSEPSKPNRFTGTNFVLTSPIDLTNQKCMPIGAYTDAETISFGGSFDGNGLIISGFNWDIPGAESMAFFGSIGVEGYVKNLGLNDISIKNAETAAGFVVDNWGKIEDCFARGYIENADEASGFCGRVGAKAVIRNSYSTVDIDFENAGSNVAAGFVIRNLGGQIDHSYYSGVFMNETDKERFGFAAKNQEGSFEACFYNQDMTGDVEKDFEGIIAFDDEDMLDPDFVSLLNFAQGGVVFEEDLNRYNGGYPVLTWENDGGVRKIAVGDFIFLRNNDFGTLNGAAVRIDPKSKLSATYAVPFKIGKTKKLGVKLDKKQGISDLGAYMQVKQALRLVNTKVYNQKIKSGKTTRAILLADSGLNQVQLDTASVIVRVQKGKALSTGMRELLMAIPVIDSQAVMKADTGLKSEKTLLVVAVKYAGSKTKCHLEYLLNGKVKKMNLPAVAEKKIPASVAAQIKSFMANYPGASLKVFKLNKKFNTIPTADVVIDNRNGMDAHLLK